MLKTRENKVLSGVQNNCFFYYSQNFVLIVFIFLVKLNDFSIHINKKQVLKKSINSRTRRVKI